MPATESQALVTACTPTQKEGTADHSPDNPISCCSTVSPLLTLTKIAHFPLVWVSRNPSQSIRNYLLQILVTGTLLSYGEHQFQMKEMISDVSLSHSRLSSIEHTPVAACWHSASFKYAFIPHSRLSTQQTILHYNPASHSPDCCCPLQKYLRSQVSLCYQVQQHCQ